MNLLEQAQQIKNETEEGANTANRIGTLLEYLANPPVLDAEFSANTAPQTVGTEWEDINADYVINYQHLFSWDAGTKSFLYSDGDFERSIKVMFTVFVESAGNNEDFEFGIFVDEGGGFQLEGVALPYSFRTADDTQVLTIGTRFDISTGTKFKLRVRKPSGSSDLKVLASKVLI